MFPAFAGTEVLYEEDRVIGVRTGDKGIDADGSKKPNFEPGIDLRAKVTVFGEGSRGSLTKNLIKKFHLDEGKNPQSYVVGVKEVWELPEGRIQPGDVIHTMGYPLKSNTYGGGFVYGMKENKVAVGLLVGLDYARSFHGPSPGVPKTQTTSHLGRVAQGWETDSIRSQDSPVGGYFSVPKLIFPGGVLVGDSASLFISMKLKGIHAAMKSGMLAAETIFESMLKEDFSEKALEAYSEALRRVTWEGALPVPQFPSGLSEGTWIAGL